MVNTTVHAKSIDKRYITFECPFCWTKYKKNGEPYKTAKRETHYHGSGNEFHNRTEHRSRHCSSGDHNKKTSYDGGFYIVIDDNTIRK